jgi:DNA-binding response OmpR family regulator
MEVLEKSSERVPDLYILDVMMPRMSGFEVCEELKDREASANVPVLFLSARGEPPHVKRGFHVGADDYLAKPFDPEELMLRVRALLRRSRRVRPGA